MAGSVINRLLAIGGSLLAFALPKYAEPEHVGVSADGAVWVSEQFGGLARLDPSGTAKEFLEGGEEYVNGFASGPDGSLWVAADRGLVQIDRLGRVTRRSDISDSAVAVASDGGGAVWIATGDARLVRLGADGTRRELRYPELSDGQTVEDIAAAPDGSVWFVQTGLGRDRLWRMSADGTFTRWRVPGSLPTPRQLAVGADGAAWLTGRHGFTRVAPDGRMTRRPLADEATPHQIVPGMDGNLWFTTDECLGRLTGAGAVTTWRVPGAVQLQGLVAAADGSFTLADQAGNAIRHLNPTAVAPTPCGAATITRTAGATTATMAGERTSTDSYWDVHVHIAREGVERYREAVPSIDGGWAHAYDNALQVRDLDGDGEPEVLVTVNWSGTQCCVWSRIYRYDRARNAYAVDQRMWGYYASEPVVRDLDGDGRPELRSLDDDFYEHFAHQSQRPVQIWSYRQGKLRDVTDRFPRLIRNDAAKLWRWYRKSRYARGTLPAWMADQYRLGRKAHADRVLDQARARGELDKHYGYEPRDPDAFVKAVKAYLRRSGY
ncbi:hypothetical protein OJ997_35220 [Solirubrobacter phytolaccae]|uniref:Uncharacterized protein n=1 Tax=Solirubrobacter phytolaccae TaxID=1404360 RepID=A0A9X3NIL7_9ACTN|nr:hypothetical protein [Solirubrobacter phytolaccae]MDA0185610.1 hypothetical protein [Solirubrobacter phytolaccae]